MDFGRLAPSARQAVAGDRAGGGLIAGVAWGMLAGLGTAIVMMLITAMTGSSGLAAFIAIMSSVVAGLGMALLASAILVQRRLPEEIDEVFRVAEQVASEASEQLEQAAGSAEQLVRGVVLVSAIPAVSTVVARRFLVVAPLVRALVEGLLLRLVDRGMPAVMATMPDATPKVREIATGMIASRDRVIGRVGTLARWATAPFQIVGLVLAGVSTSIAILIWVVI